MKKTFTFIRRVLAYHFVFMLALLTIWFVGYCFVYFDYPHFATWTQDSRRDFLFGYGSAACISLLVSGGLVGEQQLDEKYGR